VSTMADDFLSQEEVNVLLKGVAGQGISQQGSGRPAGFRPYNLATQERIVRGRMPTL